MTRKITAIVTALAMVLSLLPVGALPSWAAEGEVKYLDADGNLQSITATEVTAVTEKDTEWGADDSQEHWYVVEPTEGGITINQRVTVTGDVHLILADGASLTVNGGIGVRNGNSFTIYGQSAGSGALTAQKVADNNAGIGGTGEYVSGGRITINGGTVMASGGSNGAGIGGGYFATGGAISINGGTVTATGGKIGAGIGGGYRQGGGTITITGGRVTANAGSRAAGIGGGGNVSNSLGGIGGDVTISGGIVIANGSAGGAGIGGGERSESHGSFTTTASGKAIVIASAIGATNDQANWRGLIFNGSSGALYGDSITATSDFTIPSGKTLTLTTGQTVTIPDGVTLTNNGTIDAQEGTLDNQGTIINHGTILGTVGGDVRGTSTVNVHFEQNGETVSTAYYGDTVTVVATMVKKQVTTNSLSADLGTVNFYFGGTDGTKLNAQPIAVSSDGDTYTASTTFTITGTQWKWGYNTITADFGGVKNNTEGLAVATGSAQLTMGMGKSAIADVTVTKDGQEPDRFTYGDTITISGTITIASTGEVHDIGPSTERVFLKSGDRLISDFFDVDENGHFTVTYDTTDKDIGAGENTLTLHYYGDDYLTECDSAPITVNLQKKQVSSTYTGDALTKTYDGTADIAEAVLLQIDGLYNGDDVTATAVAHFEQSAVGNNLAVAFDAPSLSGNDAGFYDVSAPTNVTGSITSAPLAGSLTIEGDAVFGKELTANYKQTLDESVTYQWKRGGEVIQGATESTYQVTEADIGKTLSVVATASDSNHTGSVSASTDTAVAKAEQDAPKPGEGYTINYEKETITAESGCEFENGAIEISDAAGKTVKVRKKATTTHEASDWTEVKLPERPAQPDLAINNASESVTIPAGHSYKLDGDKDWTPCKAEKSVKVDAEKTITIRKNATTDAFASAELTLTAPAQGDTPNLTIDNASESVTIPAGHSYKLDKAESWTKCDKETPVNVEPKQSITIRKDATGEAYASDAQTLTAPARGTTPDFKIDNAKESITISAGYSYKLDGKDWIACDKETVVPVDPLQKMTIRKDATTTEYASDPQELTAPSRLDAPTSVVGSINTLSGLDPNTMEYSRDGKTWAAVKGTSMDLTAGDYYVRFKATTEKFASDSVKVTVKPYNGKYSYETSVTQPEHGKIVVDKYVTEGENVTITVTPDDGYVVDSVSVTDKRGKTVEVTKNSDGTYSFTMPKGNVSITATFVESDEPEPEPQPEPSELPFTDVSADAWYIDPVRFVYSEGLMTGTTATTFSPNLTTTRGMIVAILYRMEGEPDLSDENLGYPFADVDASAYYGDAVYWARLNGIVSGYSSESFGPTDSITREQLAAILYNYAAYKGVDTSARADLSSYTDAGTISGWATDAMQWANAEGIVNGMSASELAPKGNATRAQVAAMLQRYVENILA
ncbi:MAG: S-layer homology domain-containing protein [Peptococcaceae bacterium]|nr:S-layer homology domain-containing protein [Peptococcaceae bacterium]